MAAKKANSPAADETPIGEMATRGKEIHEMFLTAHRIRVARGRVPTPSYDDIAKEVGCSVKTVYNVLKGVTHAPRG